MKDFNFMRIVAMAVLTGLLVAGCKKEETTITIDQADLDAVSHYLKSATGGFAHGGPDGISADSTIREVYSTLSDISGDFPAGNMMVKKTYKKGPDGNKTDTLYVTFAMVKRESTYDPDNENWEYVMIPFDETVDYGTHPYGMLPPEGDNRGKIDFCISCHAAAAGGDYLYSND